MANRLLQRGCQATCSVRHFLSGRCRRHSGIVVTMQLRTLGRALAGLHLRSASYYEAIAEMGVTCSRLKSYQVIGHSSGLSLKIYTPFRGITIRLLTSLTLLIQKKLLEIFPLCLPLAIWCDGLLRVTVQLHYVSKAVRLRGYDSSSTGSFKGKLRQNCTQTHGSCLRSARR